MWYRVSHLCNKPNVHANKVARLTVVGWAYFTLGGKLFSDQCKSTPNAQNQQENEQFLFTLSVGG